MENSRKDIRALSKGELRNFFKESGQAAFRGEQVYEWLWKKSAHSFEAMTNLSKDLRKFLEDNFVINAISLDHVQKSSDGTVKTRFRLHDSHLIEGVLIPTEDRMTACVSSQVGCSLTCRFCATGKMERIRNLTPDEIYDEVVLIWKQAEENYQQRLSNIVFMGMGEPLLNYSNVLKATEMICSPEGLNMSAQRITVSTAGIAKMIKKLGDDQVRFNLALSLHAANDKKRSQIMPINESNSLENLAESLRYFYSKTGNRVTFEYIVFKNFNDEIEDARELLKFSRNVPSKVNLIEYNPIEKDGFENASVDKIEKFQEFLKRNGLQATIRRSRGKDIDAACGQLANKELDN